MSYFCCLLICQNQSWKGETVVLNWLSLKLTSWTLRLINQSIAMYRMRRFLAVLRSLFHSSLSYAFSCHSSPPTILPSSLTSSSHLFRGLPLGLVVSKFIYNSFLGILFSSILCTCPNQRNLCSLIVSVIVGFFNICINFFIS